MAATQGQQFDTSTPVSFGIEAALDWSNDVFTDQKFGPVGLKKRDDNSLKARPGSRINAKARVELGLEGLSADASQLNIEPARARISSRAALENFSIIVFEAIEIVFNEVAFTLSEDGRKEFTTTIADVQLFGPLAFLNQLSRSSGASERSSASISTSRRPGSESARPSGFLPKEGDPLFIGPAGITNLSLGWGVMIPTHGPRRADRQLRRVIARKAPDDLRASLVRR